MTISHHASLLATLALLSAGCLGVSEDEFGTSSSLDAEHAEPLPTVHVPESAAADGVGCTGKLDGSETFAVEVRDVDVLVAMRDGAVVCMGSYEAISSELHRTGAHEDARELGARYVAWLTAASAVGPGDCLGDPSPRPSLPSLGTEAGDEPTDPRAGDPSPRPSTPREGDPSPRPSAPAGAAASAGIETAHDPAVHEASRGDRAACTGGGSAG